MPLSTTIPFSLTRRISRRLRSISYNNVFIKYTVDEVINSYLNKEIIKKVPKKNSALFSSWKINPDFDINRLNHYNIIFGNNIKYSNYKIK
jgi:hypothetical protein